MPVVYLMTNKLAGRGQQQSRYRFSLLVASLLKYIDFDGKQQRFVFLIQPFVNPHHAVVFTANLNVINPLRCGKNRISGGNNLLINQNLIVNQTDGKLTRKLRSFGLQLVEGGPQLCLHPQSIFSRAFRCHGRRKHCGG